MYLVNIMFHLNLFIAITYFIIFMYYVEIKRSNIFNVFCVINLQLFILYITDVVLVIRKGKFNTSEIFIHG